MSESNNLENNIINKLIIENFLKDRYDWNEM